MARTPPREITHRAHIVGEHPVPTKILRTIRRSNDVTIHVACPDGQIGYARTILGNGSNAMSKAHADAVALFDDLPTLRLTIEMGRIMEIAHLTAVMHEADLAILADGGIGEDAIARWARPQTLWSNEVYPKPSVRKPHPHIAWFGGQPIVRRSWDDGSGDPIRYQGGFLRIPALPDTIETAMAGEPLDRFVELDGLAGLGLTIASATGRTRHDPNGVPIGRETMIAIAGGQRSIEL